MRLVQIEEDVLEMMFEVMEYQTRLIDSLSNKFLPLSSEKWLSTDEVATLLSVSERKVRTMKATGQLGFIKLGRTCMYKPSDVLAKIKKVEQCNNRQ